MCFPSTPAMPGPTPEEKALTAAQTEGLGIQNQILREQLEETKRTREMLELYGPSDVETQEKIRELTRQEMDLAGKQYDLQLRQFEAAEIARPGEEAYRGEMLSVAQQSMEMQKKAMEYQAAGMPAEEAYRKAQLDLATKSMELMEEYLTPKEKTEAEQALEDVGLLQAERLKQAYAGELPLDVGTMQRKEEERRQIEENLSRKLGPNWRESTPGIQTMSEWEERWASLEDAMRRGEIDAGTARLLSGATTLSNIQSQDPAFQKLMMAGGYQPTQTPLYQYQPAATPQFGDVTGTMYGRTGATGLYGFPEMMGGYGQYTQGAGAAAGRLGTQRMQGYDIYASGQMQRGANQAALYGSLISAGGMAGGMYL